MERLPADISLLEKQGYRLDEVLTHAELVPFILRYLKQRTGFTRAFIALNITFALTLLSACVYANMYRQIPISEIFLQTLTAPAVTLLLIPVHEGLHGLAYKICGAPSVTYEAHWKKLYFTANADKFVIGRKAFYLVGLTPFVIISLLLLITSFFTSPGYSIMLLTVLALHATMCAGDFGLLSYFESKKDNEVITFDDMASGRSYFLVR